MCAATEHIIQTKLATDAKASDSRARRTMCGNPSVGGPVDRRLIVPLSFLFAFCSQSSLLLHKAELVLPMEEPGSATRWD